MPQGDNIQAKEKKEEGKSLRERQEEYEKKLRANIEMIKSFYPDFEMSEEEIKAHVSEERIKIHDRATKYERDKERVRDESRGTKVPDAFNRIDFAFLDKEDTPEAREKNKKILEQLTAATDEGIEFKKQLYVDQANKMLHLDSDKVINPVSFEDAAKFVFDNMDTFEVGMEQQTMHQQINNACGHRISPARSNAFKQIEDKGVILGGMGRAYRELASSETMLTIPFEKLSVDQIFDIRNQLIAQQRPEEALFEHVSKFKLQSVTLENYVEPKTNDFKARDFEDTVPDFNKAKDKFARMYKGLKEANKWYSRNSPEYVDLLDALKKVSDRLNNVDGAFETYPDDLKESLLDLSQKANDYIQHVGEKGKNTRQQTRLDITKEIKELVGSLTEGEISFDRFVEKHNNDVAREYYNEVSDYMYKPADGKEPDLSEGKYFDEETKKIIREKNEAYTKSVERTEKIKEELETMPEGIKKDIFTQVVEAREKLADYLGREGIGIDDVQPYMATIIAGTYAKQLYDFGDSSDDLINTLFEMKQNEITSSKEFRDLNCTIGDDGILDFLSGSGEKKVKEQYLDKMSRLKEIEIREKSQKQAENNGPEKEQNEVSQTRSFS